MKKSRWGSIIFLFGFCIYWIFVHKEDNHYKHNQENNSAITNQSYISKTDTDLTYIDTSNYNKNLSYDTGSVALKPILDTIKYPNTFPDSSVVEIKSEIISSGGSIYGAGLVDSPFPLMPPTTSSIISSSTNSIPLYHPEIPKPDINIYKPYQEPYSTDVYRDNNTNINYNTNTNVENISGYYRKNGTYVAPYVRTSRNSTTSDNFSTKRNYNPYTGKIGTRKY